MKEITKKTIDQRIDARLVALSAKVATLRFVNDEKAEKSIEKYLVEARAQGLTEVTAFDVMTNTGIPTKQVLKIFQKFVEEERLEEK